MGLRSSNEFREVMDQVRGGEVLLTEAVRETAERLDHLHLEDVGQVKLKGCSEPPDLSHARPSSESEADR